MADAQLFQKVELIPVDRIRPNAFNPNAMPPAVYQQLVDNIKGRGFRSAVYILPADAEGVHVIVDGEHRWKAAKEAGLAEIPCVVLPATEDEAKMDCVTMNQLRGDLVPVRLALLIADLAQRHPLEALEQELGFEQNELKDQLELLKLPDDIGRALEMQAEMEEQEALQVLTFVVHRPQAEAIEEAIGTIERQMEGRNRRGQALEYLAKRFLAGDRTVDRQTP
ncbi:MAG: ParB N-terminal domain-containing protein [Candidatus Omnitrophica bacterium]|nr:ParB N-terminal domain-containing protein [Candidatus Omnitrophota bacterium]